MVEILVLLLSLTCLSLAAWVVWIAGGRDFLFTAPVIYLLIYFFYHFPLYFIVDEPRWEYLIALNLGLVGFSLGVGIALHKSRPRTARIQWTWRSILDRRTGQAYVGLLIFALLIMLLYFDGFPPTVSIFMDLLSDRDIFDLPSYRMALNTSHYFGGEYTGQGVLKLANELSWQLIMVLTFTMAMVRRQRSTWLLFGATFILGSISLYGGGVKGPLAWTLVAMFIAKSYISHIRIRNLFLYSVVLLFLIFLLMASQPSRYTKDAPVITSVGSAIANRIFMGNGYHTYEIVTRRVDGEIAPRYGYEHLTLFMNALPGVQFDKPFAYTLFLIMKPDAPQGQIVYASYTYLGSMYLDFGMPGVFLFSLLTGMVLQIGQRIIWRWRPSLLTVSFGAILTLKLGRTVTGSLISLGPVLIVLGIIYAIAWAAIRPVKRLVSRYSATDSNPERYVYRTTTNK